MIGKSWFIYESLVGKPDRVGNKRLSWLICLYIELCIISSNILLQTGGRETGGKLDKTYHFFRFYYILTLLCQHSNCSW